MCLPTKITDWKIKPRFFAESFGKIMSEPILLIQFDLLKCFRLKRTYTVLFELTHNLFATIHENISLHDSNNEKTVVSLSEKDTYIWV